MNLVTRRLIHGLIFFPSIPSMIACPANVPVVEDDCPEDWRVIPKITAAGGAEEGKERLIRYVYRRNGYLGIKCGGSHNHYGRIHESCHREHNDTLGLMETQYILLEFHPRVGHPVVCECGMEEDGVRHDCRSDDPNCKEEFGYCAKSGYD